MTRPKEIARRLQVWMDKVNITQSQLAERTGLSQPWVSRIVRGDFKRVTEPVHILCKYAGIDIKKTQKPDPEGVKEIMDGVYEVWDGSIKGAREIKNLLITISKI